jgi:hypothetical protein
VIVLLGTGGANGGGYTASKYVVLAIHGFFLILHGLINSLPIRWLSWFGKLGAFWNTAGVLSNYLDSSNLISTSECNCDRFMLTTCIDRFMVV